MTMEALMPEPVISEGPINARGGSFVIREWSHGPNEGPPMHVHEADDEAWHVLEGTLRFRFGDRTVDAHAGWTVFVPAGVAHTYGNPGPGDASYLIISTQRVFDLIDALHSDEAATGDRSEVYERFAAQLADGGPAGAR